MYTVYDLAKDVDSNLHGGAWNQLQDPYKIIGKGVRALLGKVRPEELIRSTYIEDAIYPHVDRYACPSDLKYKDIINIQKLSDYRNVDTMTYPLEIVYQRRFSQKRRYGYNSISVNYDNGIKYISIFKPKGLDHRLTSREVIHNCNSLTDNGSWNVGGNIVNFKLDELNYLESTGSFSFDINDSGTTGYFENFTLEAFDLETFLAKGAIFTWFNFPLPRNITSVKLTMGSDSSNLATDLYYSTVNQPHDNNEFISGWNLLKYMLQKLVSVGTPNPKALTYIRFDITTTGEAVPGCNVDLIVARKGAVYEMTYNSRYMFVDAQTKAWKLIPNKNSDIIVAEDDTYDILVDEVTLMAQFELYGESSTARSDMASIESRLKEKYNLFNIEHKSEAVLPMDDVHIFGNMFDGYSGSIEDQTGYFNDINNNLNY